MRWWWRGCATQRCWNRWRSCTRCWRPGSTNAAASNAQANTGSRRAAAASKPACNGLSPPRRNCRVAETFLRASCGALCRVSRWCHGQRSSDHVPAVARRHRTGAHGSRPGRRDPPTSGAGVRALATDTRRVQRVHRSLRTWRPRAQSAVADGCRLPVGRRSTHGRRRQSARRGPASRARRRQPHGGARVSRRHLDCQSGHRRDHGLWAGGGASNVGPAISARESQTS